MSPTCFRVCSSRYVVQVGSENETRLSFEFHCPIAPYKWASDRHGTEAFKLEAYYYIHRSALVHLRAVVNATHAVVAHARNRNRVITARQHGDVAMWQAASRSDDRGFAGCASSGDDCGFASCCHISIRALHYRRAFGDPVNLGQRDGHTGQQHGAKNSSPHQGLASFTGAYRPAASPNGWFHYRRGPFVSFFVEE